MVVVFSDHAIRRCRERGIDGKRITWHITTIPRCPVPVKWKLKSGIWVVVTDRPDDVRLVISVGWNGPKHRKVSKR